MDAELGTAGDRGAYYQMATTLAAQLGLPIQGSEGYPGMMGGMPPLGGVEMAAMGAGGAGQAQLFHAMAPAGTVFLPGAMTGMVPGGAGGNSGVGGVLHNYPFGGNSGVGGVLHNSPFTQQASTMPSGFGHAI